jgi:protocatechuate 3,4-dioxygenase beta subunit
MNGLWKKGPVVLWLGMAVSALSTAPAVRAEDSVKADIFGHVTLPDGKGLGGVSLKIGDSDRVYARTDAQGSYRISRLAPKSYVVRALKVGYKFAPETRAVTLPTVGKPTSPAAEANFKATQLTTLTISGLIRTPDRKPVPKVTVTLSAEGFTSRSETTNADGIYTFGKLPYGKFTVTPKATGFTFDPEKYNLTIPNNDGEFAPNGRANFTAKPVVAEVKANIYGTIKNPSGGPVAGVGIYLGDGKVAVTTTNADGKYTIVNPGKGTYVVKPKKEGGTLDPVSRTVTLPTTGLDTSPHAIASFIFKENKTSSYAIRGKVSNSSGAGVSGTGIYLGDGTTAVATTNSEGKYVIEELVTGRYVVKAKKEGSTFTPTSVVVELPTSGATASPDGVANFTVQTPATKYAIRGRVTGAGGAGVSGIGIFLGDATTAAITTNSEGRYALEGLVAGRYVVKAKKEGSTFTPASIVVELPTAGATASPDGVANFEAQTTSTKYLIRGRIVGGTGVALAGVEIRIADAVRATTNSEGRYTIEGLEAGTYNVIPRKERFTFTPTSKAVTLPTTSGGATPNAEANFVGQEQAAGVSSSSNFN